MIFKRMPYRLGLLAGSLLVLAFLGQALYADVALLDHRHVRNQQIKLEKLLKRHPGSGVRGSHNVGGQGFVMPMATGSEPLIDNDGMKWFINTNITFSTTSSASGAMSEAEYTHAVAASTLGGGTASSTLNDAFDGYNTLAVSDVETMGPPRTGSYYIFYNKNGPAFVEGNGRQVDFPIQTLWGTDTQDAARVEGKGPQVDWPSMQIWRKVFVPSDAAFARWLNFFKNVTDTPLSFNVFIANNLGSDSNTRITGSSNGDMISDLTDTWVGTMQNFSGTTSSDPREAHVLQGNGAVPVPLIVNHFVNGDDNPYWAYTLTIQPGQTACLMNFCVLKPTIAAAAGAAGPLAALTNAHALDFMTTDEKAQVKNFNLSSQYWLTVKSTAGGSTRPAGSAQYDADSIVRIQATPDPGYHFVNWTHGATGTTNPLNYRITGDSVVWANFSNLPPTVKITNPADGSYVNGPVTVTATATDDTSVVKVEFYIDGSLRFGDSTAPYAYDWNALLETVGSHAIKAVATDTAGATGSDQITVQITNISVSMTGSRQVEQAWVVRREYAALTVHVSNAGGAVVQKYVLYRKAGSGAYASVKELTPAQVGSGVTINDGPLTKGVVYTYKLTAFVGGAEVAVSNEVAI